MRFADIIDAFPVVSHICAEFLEKSFQSHAVGTDGFALPPV